LALGVKNVELVTREDIAKFVPQLRVDDILGGTFCQTDGFVDPHSVMMGFMLNARERGVRLWLDTAVTGIEVAGAESDRPASDPVRLDRALVPPSVGTSQRRITGVMTSRGF